jgi:hypothetical protein
MTFFAKRHVEPIPEIETNVWSCSSSDCAGWMRTSYSFNENPACPLCQSEMAEEVRVLPVIQ